MRLIPDIQKSTPPGGKTGEKLARSPKTSKPTKTKRFTNAKRNSRLARFEKVKSDQKK